MGFSHFGLMVASLWAALLFLGAPEIALAQGREIDSGDTSWVLLSSALVMLMIPAVGLFYAGMVRRKNALSTLMLSFTVLGLISIQWVIIGYTLAFGPDVSGLIGDLSWLGLRDVSQSPNPDYASTVPHLGFVGFQAMFAAITPALISGAFVDRIKFSSFIIFTLIWSTLVYDPIAHWVWGSGGWLGNLGALDFAGGTVIHVASGVSAFAFALVIGARRGYKKEPMEPHNIPMTVLGAALLWFGWFGFNAGSALSADGIATNALIVTNIAAAAAALSWMTISWIQRKPSGLGLATGAVAGLVAITPAAGFVGPVSAIAIGAIAGTTCYYAVSIRMTTRLDESLDVLAIHGVGGLWGALATGIFASTAINPAGADGLLFGNPSQLAVQVAAVVVISLFAFSITWIIVKAIGATIGLRVTEKEEGVGLDISQHGEIAYSQ